MENAGKNSGREGLPATRSGNGQLIVEPLAEVEIAGALAERIADSALDMEHKAIYLEFMFRFYRIGHDDTRRTSLAGYFGKVFVSKLWNGSLLTANRPAC
jgi:hypothetical protein